MYRNMTSYSSINIYGYEMMKEIQKYLQLLLPNQVAHYHKNGFCTMELKARNTYVNITMELGRTSLYKD